MIDPVNRQGAPAVGWASGPLGAVQAADREIARQTAVRARALARFAASRPAAVDRPAGEPGCMSPERRASRPQVLTDVSEWAAQEVAMALSIPDRTAEDLLARSLTLVHRLPSALEALESGLLHVGHLWVFLEKVAPIEERSLRQRLERDLLDWVAGRSVTTSAQLGAKARRELLARNVRSAARDLAAALRQRGVYVRPDRVDGMATLSALLTVPEAAALVEALGAYADAIVDDPADGLPRTRQQKMADCLLDLVLRPGESDVPVVRAQLTVVAPVSTLAGGDQPGEVEGQPVPADMVRALAHGLGLLPTPSVDDERPAADVAMTDVDERWWAELEARALRDEWDDDPPPDEQQRLWEETAAELAADPEWAALFGDPDEPAPVCRPAAPGVAVPQLGEEPSWWAAADAAVDEATTASLRLHRALATAQRAVRAAEIADRADTDAWEESAAARISSAPDALAALAAASAEARAALAGLLERTAGGGLADRPRIALTDALTGALLALTDAPGLRAAGTCGARACRTGRTVCDHDLRGRPGLGPPVPCDTYRPGADLDRFLRTRDRRCRQPGCRHRVAELDHHDPWPHGTTAADGMTGFCTRHHRGKHQAPGWTYDLTDQGTLIVTTPTGMTACTDPPPF
jgi:hypothetical protein